MKIQSVKLNDGKLLDFGDFNVIIGGNAVGKTTLLLELFSRAEGKERTRQYWLSKEPLDYSSDNPLEELKLLQGSMAYHYEGVNRFYFSQSNKNLEGNIDLDGHYRFNLTEFEKLKSIIDKAEQEEAKNLLKQIKYQRPFLTFASCESRLNLPNDIEIRALNQSPQDALNVLFRNRALKKQIDANILGQFHLYLALLDHKKSRLELGLSRDNPPSFNDKVDDLQEEFLRIENWKEQHYTSIQDVGHGIRSMVKLLMSLLDPVNQIVLIDEPELFIYPAQKRWLGKQLVSLAQKQGKQVFLVTHDPIILQGILDMPGKTHILRIEMDEEGKRTLRQCDLKHIEDVGAKRNQDSYLQGLFYQRSLAVEGATDRAFYQVMVEELMGNRIENRDLGFIACGGKGASKNVAHITSQVGLQSAFIYDFDVLLFDIPVLRDIVIMLHGKFDKLDGLAQLLQDQFGGDEKQIKEETDQAHKVGMQSSFVQKYKEYFKEAIIELREVGIFIVPGGSLESWAPELEQKARFAEIAPDLIKGQEELRKPLEQFLDVALKFLGC
jgi:predicted ATPase